MFCHITQNWGATPRASLLIVIALISNTTTKTGLNIFLGGLYRNTYLKGIKVSDADMGEPEHNPRRVPPRIGAYNIAPKKNTMELIVFGRRLSSTFRIS